MHSRCSVLYDDGLRCRSLGTNQVKPQGSNYLQSKSVLSLLCSSPTSDVNLVFSAYGFTSSLSTNGACNIVESPTETLSPPFSVTSTPGNELMGYTAVASFVHYVGHPDCGFQFVAPTNSSQVTDVVRTSRLPSSSTLSLSSSRPTASSTPAVSGASSSLDTKEKIILGTVLPITILVLAIFGTLAWLAHRRRKLAAAATAMNKDPPTSHAETQLYLRRKAELAEYERSLQELETQRRGLRNETRLYLQQKSELEDFARRVHELEGRSHAHEVE